MDTITIWPYAVAALGVIFFYFGGFLVSEANERPTTLIGYALLASGVALLYAGVANV